jgi:squalene-hopene cyclase-like protein
MCAGVSDDMQIHKLPRPLRIAINRRRLPKRAFDELIADLTAARRIDPGVEAAIDAGCAWLARAQDMSTTSDGGVAKHFSLLSGWSTSYPETTGYIVPTMLAYAKRRGDESYRDRARRMLDWLTSIQHESGAFQAGSVGSGHGDVPTTFNTGQILIGLTAGVAEFGDRYRDPMRRAADWLVRVQDGDGAWRGHQSPLVHAGAKTYDTHVAWGLFEAARLDPDRGYGEAGIKNVRWALGHQKDNGWFDLCSIKNPATPATHTIGYALRGVLEGYAFSGDPELLAAARKTGDGLWSALAPGGFLPGRLDKDWRPAARWSCLTGQAQNATNWLMLFQHTGERRYMQSAYASNRFVRWTLDVLGDLDVRGAVKGSFPVDGEYDPWVYPNWAAKFMVDACMLEHDVRRRPMRKASGADACPA